MEEKILECINFSLSSYLYSDAIFFSERLFASVANDHTVQILAGVHIQSGKVNRAYQILKKHQHICTSPQNKYLLALCSFQLGKLRDAEQVLQSIEVISGITSKDKIKDTSDSLFLSTCCHLLGQVYVKMQQRKRAVDYFKKSLQLNPFLWSSYECLCKLGEDVNTKEIFALAGEIIDEEESEENFDEDSFHNSNYPSIQIHPSSTSSTPLLRVNSSNTNISMNVSSIPDFTPIVVAQKPNIKGALASAIQDKNLELELSVPNTNEIQTNKRKKNESEIKRKVLFQTPDNTPTHNNDHIDHDKSRHSISHTGAITRSKSNRTSIGSHNTSATNSINNSNQSRKRTFTHPPVNMNLSTDINEHKHLNDDISSSINFSPINHSVSNLSLDSPTPIISHTRSSIKSNHQGIKDLLRLLRIIGEAYKLLCSYKCKESISTFNKLPSNQLNTGWILSNIGRAYYELVMYIDAKRYFEQVRKLEPYRTEGMEIYSSLLWHMKKETEISYLAQEMTEIDKLAPESWCVVGNCFSLQKDHETAIKFFQRAIQLDPYFAYAYTLCGHEYVASDDLDKALTCFRNASRIDDRHYNAWYGMGMIYYRQEKLSLAEYHFQRAIQINPLSSVLYCYLGMVLHSFTKVSEDNSYSERSLSMLEKAMKLDPKNNLAKFKHASVLGSLGKFQEALNELEELKETAPKEPAIFYMIGKIHKKLGNLETALNYLTSALDFDGKNATFIKHQIDNLHLSDANDDLELME